MDMDSSDLRGKETGSEGWGSPPECEGEGAGEGGVGGDGKRLLEGEVRLGSLSPSALLGAAADHAARPLSFRAAVKVQLARVRLLEPVARRRRLELTPSWRRTLAKPLCQARMAMQHGNRPSCSSFCLGTYRKS